jgi:hypothetical protein
MIRTLRRILPRQLGCMSDANGRHPTPTQDAGMALLIPGDGGLLLRVLQCRLPNVKNIDIDVSTHVWMKATAMMTDRMPYTSSEEQSMSDWDIFRHLSNGVDEFTWNAHAEELRERGYSVFDIAISNRMAFEIISPDCINTWQLAPGVDGHLRLC